MTRVTHHLYYAGKNGILDKVGTSSSSKQRAHEEHDAQYQGLLTDMRTLADHVADFEDPLDEAEDQQGESASQPQHEITLAAERARHKQKLSAVQAEADGLREEIEKLKKKNARLKKAEEGEAKPELPRHRSHQVDPERAIEAGKEVARGVAKGLRQKSAKDMARLPEGSSKTRSSSRQKGRLPGKS